MRAWGVRRREEEEEEEEERLKSRDTEKPTTKSGKDNAEDIYEM